MSGIFTHGLLKVNNWGSDKSVATKKNNNDNKNDRGRTRQLSPTNGCPPGLVVGGSPQDQDVVSKILDRELLQGRA